MLNRVTWMKHTALPRSSQQPQSFCLKSILCGQVQLRRSVNVGHSRRTCSGVCALVPQGHTFVWEISSRCRCLSSLQCPVLNWNRISVGVSAADGLYWNQDCLYSIFFCLLQSVWVFLLWSWSLCNWLCVCNVLFYCHFWSVSTLSFSSILQWECYPL